MAKVQQGNYSRIIKIFWGVLISPFVFGILFLILSSFGVFGYMPDLDELENPKLFQASEIYSSDLKMIGTYYKENRNNVNYDELPENLVNALIATEDVRFKEHSGVDFRALGRVVTGVITFNPKGGGSTITQQLAKNLFPRDKNMSKFGMGFRKLKEWVIAAKLERWFSKEEIIALYFNKFDFLNNAVGIKSAARIYFNKNPMDLKIEEAAVLVGMCQNPAFYNPLKRLDTTRHRRNVVLDQMRKYDYITEAQFDSLKVLPLKLDYRKVDHKVGTATYFREYLRDYLMKWCATHTKSDGTPYDLYKDGLRIYTTIDSRMQDSAEAAVRSHMKALQKDFDKECKSSKNAPFDYSMTPEMISEIYNQAMKRSDRYYSLKRSDADDQEIVKNFNTPVEMTVFSWNGEKDTLMSPMDSIKYYKRFLQCGFMAMEPSTGHVKAYVGGNDYMYFQYDHVCTGKRQVGSTFKPFLYALAMQEGEFTPCSKVPNIPVTFDMGEGQEAWTPSNSNKGHEGEMVTLKWALANSVNYISAFLMKRYGPEAVIQLVRKMGIKSDIPSVVSICLGTPELSLYEMTGAISTFANKGTYVEPVFITKIEDKHGNVIAQFSPKKNDAVSEETSFLMIELMKGVVQGGTASRLYRYKIPVPVAGKTGTTQNNSDGWFIGLTPNLVAGVWVGAEDRSVHFRTTDKGQGAHTALPIFGRFMQGVYSDKRIKFEKKDFDPIENVPIELNCKNYDEGDKTNDDEDPFGADEF